MWLLACSAFAAPLTVDAAASTVGFSVGSTLTPVDGRARTFTGTLDPAAGTGALTVPTAALTTGLGPRDARMLTYALEAARFPEVQFRIAGSRGLPPDGAGEAVLRGTLTVRDVTRSLDVPVHYGWEGSSVRLTGRVDLAWADYGVPDPSVLVATVAPVVTVTFDVVARPPDPPSPG